MAAATKRERRPRLPHQLRTNLAPGHQVHASMKLLVQLFPEVAARHRPEPAGEVRRARP